MSLLSGIGDFFSSDIGKSLINVGTQVIKSTQTPPTAGGATPPGGLPTTPPPPAPGTNTTPVWLWPALAVVGLIGIILAFKK